MDQGPIIKSKIVFLGDQSVGKTSIINRFIFDHFTGNQQVSPSYQPTVGVDFVSKVLNVQNKTVRMQLWDTAGQQRFHSLIPSYIKDSNAAIVVFDITNQTSFLSCDKWIEDVREQRGYQAIIFALGNKIDLETQRVINSNDAQKKFSSMNITYLEVSAKSGHHINMCFKKLSQNLANPNKNNPQNQQNNNQQMKPKSNKINLNQNKKEQKKKSCSC